MIDCAKEVRAYHDADVTLPKTEQDEMRDRRNANRTRLCNGLAKAGKPAPLEFVKQGSYAMKTMIRDPDNDYDIDDGVYFRKEDLVGERGAEMTSLQARQMVRDAVYYGKFKQAPEVRSNCVRVLYEAGYHVDLPVYRRVVTSTIFGNDVHYELAASSGWEAVRRPRRVELVRGRARQIRRRPAVAARQPGPKKVLPQSLQLARQHPQRFRHFRPVGRALPALRPRGLRSLRHHGRDSRSA